jgi:nitrate reductase gamma subunit
LVYSTNQYPESHANDKPYKKHRPQFPHKYKNFFAISNQIIMNGFLALLYTFFVEKLPYITIVVFTVGMLLRISRWINAVEDHNQPKYDLFESIKYVFLDVILFRKTYNRDKATWFLVFAFHGSIGGILFGHMRGFHLWSASIFDPLGHWMAEFMIHILPIFMGWLLIVTTLLLIVRRVRLEDKQLTSMTNDYIALVILLLAAIVGQGMRLFPAEAANSEIYSIVFIPHFIVLHLEAVPSYHWFHWHVLFTQLFVIYTPFSKFIHILTGIITPAIYGSRRKELGI